MLQGGVAHAVAPCAQPPGAYTHDGFYLRFGSSFGYAAFSGDGPVGHVSITGGASGGVFGIGGNVARGLVVGGVLGSQALGRRTLHGAPPGGPGKVDASHVNVGVLLDWFPNPAAGWHVGGTLGFGGASVSDDTIRWFGATAVGSVFGGYDMWIGPEWSLGISLAASGSPSAALKDSHGDEVGYRLAAGSIGLWGTLLYH